jgi:hypothetical protein
LNAFLRHMSKLLSTLDYATIDKVFLALALCGICLLYKKLQYPESLGSLPKLSLYSCIKLHVFQTSSHAVTEICMNAAGTSKTMLVLCCVIWELLLVGLTKASQRHYFVETVQLELGTMNSSRPSSTVKVNFAPLFLGQVELVLTVMGRCGETRCDTFLLSKLAFDSVLWWRECRLF